MGFSYAYEFSTNLTDTHDWFEHTRYSIKLSYTKIQVSLTRRISFKSSFASAFFSLSNLSALL